MPFDKAAYWQKYRKDNANRWTIKRSPLKRKPVKINPVSKRRAKQLRAYTPIRKEVLEEYPVCQAKLEGCTYRSTEIHHIGGKLEEKLIEKENLLATCRNI